MKLLKKKKAGMGRGVLVSSAMRCSDGARTKTREGECVKVTIFLVLCLLGLEGADRSAVNEIM